MQDNGKFITYIFGREEEIFGVARMRPIESMIRTMGEKEFFKKYILSKQLYDEKWGNNWAILRRFNSV